MRETIRTVLARLVANLPKGILIDQKFFSLYESKGFHITPVHFYQPIPNIAELPDEIL